VACKTNSAEYELELRGATPRLVFVPTDTLTTRRSHRALEGVLNIFPDESEAGQSPSLLGLPQRARSGSVQKTHSPSPVDTYQVGSPRRAVARRAGALGAQPDPGPDTAALREKLSSLLLQHVGGSAGWAQLAMCLAEGCTTRDSAAAASVRTRREPAHLRTSFVRANPLLRHVGGRIAPTTRRRAVHSARKSGGGRSTVVALTLAGSAEIAGVPARARWAAARGTRRNRGVCHAQNVDAAARDPEADAAAQQVRPSGVFG